jgi:hypothetical protein
MAQKGWSIAFAFAASRFAIIEKSAIQNFFSSNSSTVLTIEMMLASSMCNAVSVEMPGHNFEKPLGIQRTLSTKSYSPVSRREGVPRSAAPRMGRNSGQLVGGAG